jgi:hypothetical protein
VSSARACHEAPDGARGGQGDSEARAGYGLRLSLRQAHERSSGEILNKALIQRTLEGKNPREYPAGGALTPYHAARDSQGGTTQEPQPGGPARGFGAESNAWGNGRWVLQVRERTATPCEGNAPKGESHERRRRETKPTGVRGA